MNNGNFHRHFLPNTLVSMTRNYSWWLFFPGVFPYALCLAFPSLGDYVFLQFLYLAEDYEKLEEEEEAILEAIHHSLQPARLEASV